MSTFHIILGHLCGFLSLLLEYTKRHPSSCGRPPPVIADNKVDNKKVIWSWVSQIYENLPEDYEYEQSLIVGSDWTNYNPDFEPYTDLYTMKTCQKSMEGVSLEYTNSIISK